LKNFAITGVAGYVAPRHLAAIKATGNRLVAAADPHDAVGVLDRHSFDVRYFREFERFDRHLEKLRRGPEEGRVHFMSICSPNFLHDAHIRLALRIGAQAICEKPLVINPWNLDALEEIEQETGGKVHTVLQLRVHPQLVDLRARLAAESRAARHDVVLTYVTSRGPWYDVSWKGSEERSGGVATNIGIHFFDLVLWLFGAAKESAVHLHETHRMAGVLELERARVRWFLSTDAADLPLRRFQAKRRRTARSPWTGARSSSARVSAICTRGSTRRSSPAAASGSRTRDRRSSWSRRSATRTSRRTTAARTRCSPRGADAAAPRERDNPEPNPARRPILGADGDAPLHPRVRSRGAARPPRVDRARRPRSRPRRRGRGGPLAADLGRAAVAST
jgi:UDP-N-acetyl-2-amino-2-deoxyglucuronate dehydrogenase